MKKFLIACICTLSLAGCAALLPSAPTLPTSKLSDEVVIESARVVQNFYVSRSGKAKIIGTSGAIGLAGIATAGASAAQGGASVGVMSMIITIGNFLGQAIGIFEPTERAIIYDAGASDIELAIADYMDATSPDTGTTEVPIKGYTKQGAFLLRKLGLIKKVTNDMLNHVRPSKDDLVAITAKLETMKPPPQEKKPTGTATPAPAPEAKSYEAI
jgi:hypothetical protein